MSSRKRRAVYVHDPRAEDIDTASTATGSRIRTERTCAPPRSPEKRRPIDNFDVAMGFDGGDTDMPPADALPEGPAGIRVKTRKKKAKRHDESDHPIKPFIPLRNAFQDALIRREGRGPWWSKGCMGVGCLELAAPFRCQDCFGDRLLCRSCMVERHRDEPLHIIEEWKDEWFQPSSLSSLDASLRFQLGHRPGEDCDFRNPRKFVVLDNNAIHELNVDFCGCLGAPELRDQLINIGWFPATVKEPETAATLSLMRRFHTLNLQGRVPAYDFYNALEVMSERSGMLEVPDRREQFYVIAREYRHLQMAKRAGRAHDAKGVPSKTDPAVLLYGIDATQPGELSIDCRACPHPGINMKEGWQNLPPDKAWINQLLLSKDANFKMKGRATSSREADPTLGPGFAYMVASDAYLEHLSKFVEEDEISHCVAFAALWRANNKRGKGLRATGIGSVSCSRHEMFRPIGTGDLQRGERYSNMDYLWLSSVMFTTLLMILASYDIACQWSINFWERMKKAPKHLRLPEGIKVRFKVPKFHLPPHVKKCHGPFSFNYTKGAGRTDGEGVERNWSWLNMAARSISVMGPGSREDTLDDFCGFANWRKTVDLGNSLLRKMVLYIPKAMMHNRAFEAFTDALKDGHDDELAEWEQAVLAWEEDQTKDCPYDYPEEDEPTMEEVRLRMAEEDHARTVQNGESRTNSPGSFIMAGIEIEEEQEAIKLEAKRRTRTSIQATDLQRKRTLLLTTLGKFRDEQAHFMPGIANGLAGRVADNNTKPEETPLHLPSSLPAETRAAVCISGLPEVEERLRQAQAGAGLRALRRHLRTHSFKRKHMSSQGAYTKSQALLSAIEARIKGGAGNYWRARAALLKLRGPGPWESVLQELRQSDIRGINERALNDEEKEDDRKARALAGLPPLAEDMDEYGDPVEPTVLFNLGTGEGSRVLPWIWYTGAAGDTGADGRLHDDIRLEWIKSRARAARYREELEYLEEEMSRALLYCVHKARWWDARMRPRPGVSPELAEGLCAYAKEQAARERLWEKNWHERWAPVRQRAETVLKDVLVDVVVGLEVELEEEVAYGEEGEVDDLD